MYIIMWITTGNCYQLPHYRKNKYRNWCCFYEEINFLFVCKKARELSRNESLSNKTRSQKVRVYLYKLHVKYEYIHDILFHISVHNKAVKIQLTKIIMLKMI